MSKHRVTISHQAITALLYFALFPLVFLACFLWQYRFVEAANNYIKNKDFYVYGITNDSEIHFMTIDDDRDAIVNDTAWIGGGEITYEWTDATSILVHMKNVNCHKYTPWIYVRVPDTQGYHFTSSEFGPWTGTGCAGTDAHYTGAAYIMDSTVQQYIGAQFGYSYVTFHRDPNTYFIHYDGNGSTAGLMDLQSMLYDQPAALSGCNYTKSISLSFDANGGVAIPDASANAAFLHWSRDNQSFAPETSVNNLSGVNGDIVNFQANWGNATISLPNTTRTGYKLIGWYDSKNRYVGSYNTNYSYNTDQTLYAQWKPITYTITYHANGVGNSSQDTVSQTFTYDSTGYIQSSDFSQNGFIFQNWNTAPDGSGTSYTVNQPILNLFQNEGENLDLYAMWDTDFTLDLNGNGGTLGDGKTDICIEHVNNETTLSEYVFTMQRSVSASEQEHYDRNSDSYVDYTYYYSQQGWSLNNSDYYYDDRVYYAEDSIHKYHLNSADFLINTMHAFPDLVTTDESGNVTVTMFAVWDEAPVIQSQDFYITSDTLSNMSQDGLISRLLQDTQVEVSDREDGNDVDLSVCQLDWDFLTHIGDNNDPNSPELGASSITYRATDICNNVTEYNILIIVTSSGSVRSTQNDGSVSPLYARYIDYKAYNSDTDLGGIEPDSKWNTDSNCQKKLINALIRIKKYGTKSY